MPILNQESISEERREELVAEALLDETPLPKGIKCIRGTAPLVILALQKANNPYLTGRKGFDAVGIEFAPDGTQLTSNSDFALMMMAKTAEVLILWSCSNQLLKKYAVNPALLEDAALDLLCEATTDQMAEATVHIAKQLELLSKTRAVKDESEEAPKVEMKGPDCPKAQAPIG